ncbi:MAG: AzlC family ABC transporter permease [Pseudomonadota bacterium]
MQSATPDSAFFEGMRASAPFLIVVGPFALVFGVVATEAGLDLAQVMSLSVTVFAGAAQLTALQLMREEAPALVVLASSLAVNLRMAMYSASIAPYIGGAPLWQRALSGYLLVDQSYAISHARFEADPQMPLPRRMAFFFGTMSLIAPLWYAATLAGALAGQGIPEGLALDFAVPITFIALIAPGLRTLAHLAAAATAILLGLALAGLPYGTGLLVAGLVAMIVGAEIERRGLAIPVQRQGP